MTVDIIRSKVARNRDNDDNLISVQQRSRVRTVFYDSNTYQSLINAIL